MYFIIHLGENRCFFSMRLHFLMYFRHMGENKNTPFLSEQGNRLNLKWCFHANPEI